MTIRERFRRALRKSDSSDTSSQAESNSTITTTLSASSSGHKSTMGGGGKLARTFTWGRRSKDDESDKNAQGAQDAAKDKSTMTSRSKKGRKMHPSQRPLTLQNLKHQEMLSHFTMTFGASDPAQIESLSFIGVSPCCTRSPSVDLGRADTRSSLTGSGSGSPSPDSDRD
ncbi:hypothetical protein E4U42_004157 [Claviceps africana]|uniref:Uncharacterized protein n=1 Tax=Claviceps africana TaxID=83212 RepID=A0A8K0J5G3_9HYPO|nr:hypothetical protein E4U42_004157 [Claviceps africana]